MLYAILKAALSGVIVAIVSEVARRRPGFGALIASLPLISILGMIWLWRDTRDPVRLADHAQATLLFVIPSLPMFALIPFLLRRGVSFWPTLLVGCLLTAGLYGLMTWLAGRLGGKL
jgi:glycopeptide antibiotics resistance protein